MKHWRNLILLKLVTSPKSGVRRTRDERLGPRPARNEPRLISELPSRDSLCHGGITTMECADACMQIAEVAEVVEIVE